MDNKEKVSVCVITYNSSSTVTETLDSILNQSYGSKYIELVISDDYSSDNTIEIIDLWLSKHLDSFKNVEVFYSSVNQGISINFEKALKLATMYWIKPIAGDDILCENAIEELIKSVKNKKVDILFSKVSPFYIDDNGAMMLQQERPSVDEIKSFNDKNVYQQFYSLMKGNLLAAPTVIMNKNVIGYVLEAPKPKYLEDISTWLYLTSKKNIKLYITNKTLVYYRIGGISTSNHINEMKLSLYMSSIKLRIKYFKYLKGFNNRLFLLIKIIKMHLIFIKKFFLKK